LCMLLRVDELLEMVERKADFHRLTFVRYAGLTISR
jgi:hypothetical protein